MPPVLLGAAIQWTVQRIGLLGIISESEIKLTGQDVGFLLQHLQGAEDCHTYFGNKDPVVKVFQGNIRVLKSDLGFPADCLTAIGYRIFGL